MESCSNVTGFFQNYSVGEGAVILSLVSIVPILVFVLYHAGKRTVDLVVRYFTYTVEISGGKISNSYEDRLYHWVLTWLANNLEDLQLVTAGVRQEQHENGKVDTDFESPPGFGIHFFKYKGQWIQLERRSTPKIICNATTYEVLIFTTSLRNKDLIYDIMRDAKPKRKEEDEKKTVMYGVCGGGWSQIGFPKRRRNITSIILADGVSDKILNDIADFKSSEDWYMDRGIPYRRGYLLYGPPGCGKSSFIRAIAGEIGYDICILSLSSKGLGDDTLNELMNSTPENCIILLEDIDAAFKSREDETATAKESNLAFEGVGASTVTFRGLLNALDGVASTEGRIIFLTTNYVTRLDPALVRPGRVDIKVLIDYPNDDQLARMFTRFYPDPTPDEEKRALFVQKIRDLKQNVSMAMIQGLFMMHKESYQDSLDNGSEYFKEQFSIAAPVVTAPRW